jgi:hypothetical protein
MLYEGLASPLDQLEVRELMWLPAECFGLPGLCQRLPDMASRDQVLDEKKYGAMLDDI